MFEEAGNADSSQLATLLRLALALIEAFVVGERHRLVEHHRKLAAVVSGADRSLVRNFRLRDEVALTDAHRIDAADARGLVDQPLHDIIGFRSPRAAIWSDLYRVGEDAAHIQVDQRD